MSAPSKRIYSSDSRSDKLILSAISPTPGQRLQPLPPSSEPFGIPIQNSYSQNFPRRQAFSIDPVGCISPHSFGEQESTITVGEYSEHTAFTPSNELDLQLMNIDSTMSPSSDVTSPMDLCFANIIDEQSNDDNDLNNITPSIKFASSLTPLDSRDLPSGRNDTPSSSSIGRVVGVRRPARPLVKSDKMSSLSAAGIPGAGSGGGVGAAVGSCPDSFIDRRPTSLSYPLPALSYGSPTGDAGPPTAALAAPQTTCGSISSGNGTWTGGSNITSPSGDIGLMPASMGNDTQRVAMMRARNKKDSHNRIERKRRDYINCQISELGTLLPEDMFRDGDCKKNKGSILKNSVEYICALRAENSFFVDLRREATLATGVITKLVKRIQDLESFLAPEYLAKVSSTDYQTQLQEWASTHEANQQRINTTLSSPVPRPACVSLDTSESSPGMSSIGNEDLGYPDTKGVTSADSNSPVPQPSGRLDGVLHSTRTRCTSLCAPGQTIGMASMLDKVDGSRAASIHPIINSPILPFDSLPSSRRLQQGARQPLVLPAGGHSISVAQPQQASGTPAPTTASTSTAATAAAAQMLHQTGAGASGMRLLFNQQQQQQQQHQCSYGSLKHPSPSKVAVKRSKQQQKPTTAAAHLPVPKLEKSRFSGGGTGELSNLSTSLPVRMALKPSDFTGGDGGLAAGASGGNIMMSEMESDDVHSRIFIPASYY
uniref:Transcription factor E3 n=1 Tax=Schistocephalus solidus TaxID=70667 RepID=A0A0X3P8G1_SCHSO